jgi:hypothetical protein
MADGILAIRDVGSFQNIGNTDAPLAVWTIRTLDEADKLTKDAIAAAQARKGIDGKPIPIKDREQLLADNLKFLQEKYEGELVDMSTASKYNPFKIAYDAAVKLPELETNIMTAALKTVSPLANNPIITTYDESKLLTFITGEIIAGKITPKKAAADIAMFYQVAIKNQQEIAKYRLFGMRGSTEYNISVKDVGVFSDTTRTVNLSNVGSVENHLQLDTAKQLRIQNAKHGGFAYPNALNYPIKQTP